MRIVSCRCMERKLRWHSVMMGEETVRNILINTLVTATSEDVFDHALAKGEIPLHITTPAGILRAGKR